MVFWQLTIDANDPALLARFWAQALGYRPAPPTESETTWNRHYRARLGEETAFDDRIFDPAGLRPPDLVPGGAGSHRDSIQNHSGLRSELIYPDAASRAISLGMLEG
jgi:hypothetical protein